ncbi:MAG: hypothetical protein KC431_25040, partial [Myxococcales bacterium]|nr:hypothetical protein [Myxococcales bacterium]
MSRPVLVGIIALGTTGCFKPDPANDDDVGTETDTADTTTDTTDTTTETTETDTTDTTDTQSMEPPVIDLFTVAGSDAPEVMTMAGAAAIIVQASDPDGTIAEVQIFVDGDLLETIPGPGPFASEFVVAGEDFDGDYEFTAKAIDDDGLEADSAPITLSVDVTSGVEVEQWTFDSGNADNAFRVEVDPDGTNVIVGGTTYINNESRMRVDRLVGGGWVDKVEEGAFAASGMALLDNGNTVITTWTPASPYKSQRFSYDSAGMQTSAEQFDWTSPGTPPDNFEAPLDMEVGPDGNYYVAGVFTKAGDSSPNSTYMFKFNPAGDLLWQYHSDVAMEPPYPIYGINLDMGPGYLILGGQSREVVNMATDNRIWMGRWDLNGTFLDDIKIAGGNGIGWAVGAG